MENYTIDRAHYRDAANLKAIEIECGLSPWTIEAYESEFGRPEAVLLAARTRESGIIGFLAGRIPLSEGGAAEIYNIGARPSFRRRKIGSMLLEEFRSLCVDRHISAIWLEVRATNHAAIEFYRAHGFVSDGSRPNFYSSPTEDAELMSWSLA